MYSKKSGGGLWWVLGGVLLLGLGGAATYFLRAELKASPPAVVELTGDLPAIGRKTTFQLTVSEPARGIASIAVALDGAGLSKQSLPLVAALPAPTLTATFEIGKDLYPQLQEGSLTIAVTVQARGSRLRTPPPVVLTRSYAVKLQPPSLAARSEFVYPTQGGAEVIVYDVGPTATKSGVQAGDWFFPGYPLPGASDPRMHFAFFGVPYDWDGVSESDAKERIRLVAEDDVGNRTEQRFIHRYFPRPMRKDSLQLSDSFLEKVNQAVYTATPELQRKATPLEDYLQLNSVLRERNMRTLLELTGKTAQKFLWTETFQPLTNAAVKGTFADRRTYRYAGEQVDTQDHLGVDFASLANAPVPAANAGTVVLAKYLGIFGNTVILDHGFGLMSLYSHLASIEAKEGEAVPGGQRIGTTGMTGLAAGDHLHFAILIAGHPVTPIEWLDGHWIEDRVKAKLGSALPWQLSGTPKAAAKTRRRTRTRG